MDWFSLLGGAALGAFAGEGLTRGIKLGKKHRRLTEERRLSTLSNGPLLYDWLNSYYAGHGHGSDLFQCRFNDFELAVPFLTSRQWRFDPPLDIRHDVMLDLVRSKDQSFPIDQRLIEHRRSLGQRIFNDPIVYLDHIDDQTLRPRLHVKVCDYYEVATNMFRLENETLRALKHGRIGSTQFRNLALPNAAALRNPRVRPFPVGCATTFAVDTENGYEVIVHVRSRETVSWGRSRAVIPTFGLTPQIGTSRVGGSGLLLFNLIREYLEELYDYSDLARLGEQRRPSADWLLAYPESAVFSSTDTMAEILGIGVNALNGAVNLALLVIVHDRVWSERIRETLKANWEVEASGKSSTIDFVRSDSPLFEKWLSEQSFNPASAFSLSLALPRLATLK